MSFYKYTILALSVFMVAGCGRSITSTPGDAPNLKEWVEEVKNQKPNTNLEAVPVVETNEPFLYSENILIEDAAGKIVSLRDPFNSPVIPENPSALRPDPNRHKQQLEEFPLDSLSMVGTLGTGNNLRALIRSPDGVVHQVYVGNYLGQMDGKVTSISEYHLDLVELVSDGMGGWIERPASIGIEE